MLIDWFTVVAQVVNFLILVWLLKRFLYRPILNAIDAREKRISTELANVDTKMLQALQERDTFQRKNEEFDRQRTALLNRAMEEAAAERLRVLDSARQDSNDLRVKQQEALNSEQRSLSVVLTRQVRDEVFSIARKVLADLAGATLEERMTEVFLNRLRELNDDGKENLKSAFRASVSPLLVRTTFVLPAAHHAEIETAVKEMLGSEKIVQFEIAPDLVSGIEISTDGQKVAWSIADYLSSLGKNVDSLLRAQSHTDTQSKVLSKTGINADEHGA